MHAVEFIAELGPEPLLTIPHEAAAQLPKAGEARIIVVTADDSEDAGWRLAAFGGVPAVHARGFARGRRLRHLPLIVLGTPPAA
jgi:hypothetical protein